MKTPINLIQWIDAEPDPMRRMVRQGMYAVMLATADVGHHFPTMVMKGGVLLAIRYGSLRYTTDLDYSTTAHLKQIDTELFLAYLDEALQRFSRDLGFDMFCRVQSHKISPSKTTASFPTLQVKVGVARLTDAAQIRRLRNRLAVHTVAIDYSFNEWAASTQTLIAAPDQHLLAYDLTDLIAEKYRALLQQVVRNRARYQDVYDLFYMLSTTGAIDVDAKNIILAKLITASHGKLPELCGRELQNPELLRKSRERYSELSDQLVDPPEFDVAFTVVEQFYEQLPWPTSF